MTKYTPRPWRVEEGTHLIWGDCVFDDAGLVFQLGTPILHADTGYRSWGREISPEEHDANVQLAAAAPDMADALVIARAYIENGIELGYIRAPQDEDDPAHKTPLLISAALRKAGVE